MSNTESMRDAGTCLGGFLGMLLGAAIGFAVSMKVVVDRAVRNDGSVNPDQAFLPFLGVVAAGCVGAAGGALLVRIAFAAYVMVFSRPGKKR